MYRKTVPLCWIDTLGVGEWLCVSSVKLPWKPWQEMGWILLTSENIVIVVTVAALSNYRGVIASSDRKSKKLTCTTWTPAKPLSACWNFFGVSFPHLQQNLIQPRKRPLSFLLPTIVRPSEGMCGTYLCLGANNGDKALSGIVQVSAVSGCPLPQAAAGLNAKGGSPPAVHIFHPNVLVCVALVALYPMESSF